MQRSAPRDFERNKPTIALIQFVPGLVYLKCSNRAGRKLFLHFPYRHWVAAFARYHGGQHLKPGVMSDQQQSLHICIDLAD